jgi:uncharacterized protein (DUF302 family)
MAADWGVEECTVRLRRSIEAADVWLLDEIDPQKLLTRGGYHIPPARQLLFFHPRYMARLLAADPSALVEAPIKFAVQEISATRSLVHWLDPAAAFARYGNPILSALGKDLAALCSTIIEASLAKVVP